MPTPHAHRFASCDFISSESSHRIAGAPFAVACLWFPFPFSTLRQYALLYVSIPARLYQFDAILFIACFCPGARVPLLAFVNFSPSARAKNTISLHRSFAFLRRGKFSTHSSMAPEIELQKTLASYRKPRKSWEFESIGEVENHERHK